MKPLVSVVLDTYNHERFIEDAIRSVLEQEFPREQIEILVVDDGSTDRTPEIVRQFEPEVRLLRKQNGGQASAINFGVAHAKGEFVAFLDGDDVWVRNKLSRVIVEFQNHPEAVLVYHKYARWDPRQNTMTVPEHLRNVSGDLLADVQKLQTFTNVPTSALTFRLEALRRVMPIPEECSFMQDLYMIGTCACLGPFECVPEALMKYRIHGANLCFAESEQPNPEVLRRRIPIWDASITSVRKWARRNASPAARRRVALLLMRWHVLREKDEFRISAPGRYRECLHLCRVARLEGLTGSRSHVVYCWVRAFTALGLGRHAHYLEGVRTRVNRMRAVERGS